MKNLSWRLVIIAAVILAAVVYIAPTIKPGIWPHNKINLGLDLQGGMHLILEVDTEKAVESTTDRIATELLRSLKKDRVRHQGVEREGTRISMRMSESGDVDGFDDVLDRDFEELRILSRSVEDGTLTVVMDLPADERAHIKSSATAQALETIRNRIDQFGVSEPDIRSQGERRILIQLPGVTDTERAKELIGKTALLEFKLVDEVNDLQAALDGDLPAGREILYQSIENRKTGRSREIPFLVEKRASLTGAYLADARANIETQFNEAIVTMKLDKKGARIFATVTEENVNRKLAIVLDDRIYMAPNISERIPNGEAQITGIDSLEEARDLAIVLRAGALPAPVDIIEERTVGPSLGADSISKGLTSMVIGGVLVIIFMVMYYRGSGLLADLALALNILLIAGGLAALQATLTLPGIAGIILTIGLAVDANVIIFERIREELHVGKTPRAAVEAGYERSTLTILDANVTTLIAALVLFQFGTGAVKGFAVTLSLGVVASLFTALVVVRTVLDYFLMQRKVKALSI